MVLVRNKVMKNCLKTTLILLILIVQRSYGQKDVINGKIVDESLAGIPWVFIEFDSKIIDTTDFNGNFKLNLTAEMKKITVRAFGFQPEVVNISEKCNIIEVVLLESGTYDFVNLKTAERKKLRRRNKVLSKLYTTAYQKKIFINEKPCW